MTMMKMENWARLSRFSQIEILKRPESLHEASLKKSVDAILMEVQKRGDKAISEYTAELDGVTPQHMQVSDSEMTNAWETIDKAQLDALYLAHQRITNHHRHFAPVNQHFDSNDGIACEQLIRPISSVGLYVPGGSAPLISTLLMLAVPAQVAGCDKKVLCTPPDAKGGIHPLLLVAASLSGINQIYKVGGAQAIAGMAYGTETLPKVHKIFGPGNAWVDQAKTAVANDNHGAAIDLPAGPSEVLVIADQTANIAFVASDLIAQAEHGPDSQVMLITNDQNLALKVEKEVENQLQSLTRQAIVRKALHHSAIIIADSIEKAIDISNQYAPEHLILEVDQAEKWLSHIRYAGAVFVGHWLPETLGDYITGSNHVLPTSGWAKACSGLSVQDFTVAISVQHAGKQGLYAVGNEAITLAHIEGLDGHANAVRQRLKQAQAFWI